MKYKIALFDFDGVAFTGAWFSTRLHQDYGTPTEIMLPFFKGVFKQCSLGQADLKQELLAVLDTWNWPGTVDELLTYWAAEERSMRQS